MNDVHSITDNRTAWWTVGYVSHLVATNAQGMSTFQCTLNARKRTGPTQNTDYPYKPGYLERMGYRRVTGTPPRPCRECQRTT